MLPRPPPPIPSFTTSPPQHGHRQLTKPDFDWLTGKSSLFSTSKRPQLKISVYSGRRGATCGVSSDRLLGIIAVPLDLVAAEVTATGFEKTKVVAAVGFEKTKVAAKKVKEGATVGVNCVKLKYNKSKLFQKK